MAASPCAAAHGTLRDISSPGTDLCNPPAAMQGWCSQLQGNTSLVQRAIQRNTEYHSFVQWNTVECSKYTKERIFWPWVGLYYHYCIIWQICVGHCILLHWDHARSRIAALLRDKDLILSVGKTLRTTWRYTRRLISDPFFLARRGLFSEAEKVAAKVAKVDHCEVVALTSLTSMS